MRKKQNKNADLHDELGEDGFGKASGKRRAAAFERTATEVQEKTTDVLKNLPRVAAVYDKDSRVTEPDLPTLGGNDRRTPRNEYTQDEQKDEVISSSRRKPSEERELEVVTPVRRAGA